MANVAFGGGITDMRGSIGGSVFSRSAGGATVRKRTKGINPRSTRQNLIRSHHGSTVAIWQSATMAAIRASWNDYAANTPWVNKLGQAITLTGFQAFVASNALRQVAGEATVTAAPIAYGSAKLPIFTMTKADLGGNIVLTASNLAAGDLGVGALVVGFEGLPTSPASNVMSPGGRYVGKIVGASTPPAAVITATGGYVTPVGMRATAHMCYIDAQGRLSGNAYAACTVTHP
jgi:hypothetical protein